MAKVELRVRLTFDVSQALGVNEANMLPAFDQLPDNEVWVEIPGLKEAYAPSTTHVSKQI